MGTIPLVCPSCRKRDDEGWSLFTVEAASDASWRCVGCEKRFPAVSGIPLLVPHPAALIESDLVGAFAPIGGPSALSSLAESGADGDAVARHLQHASTWLHAHYGDLVGHAECGYHAFASALGALPRFEAAVELGCGVGRGLSILSRHADRVLGVDLSLSALRHAKRVLAGEPLEFARRIVGRHYEPALIPGELACDNVDLVVGDVLDPPLVPGIFDCVVALNVFDNVRSPRDLIGVMDQLCTPGGRLVLATPFAWQSGIVDDHQRFGGADPARALRELLESGDGLGATYEIEDARELEWFLQPEARLRLTYTSLYLVARKRRES